MLIRMNGGCRVQQVTNTLAVPCQLLLHRRQFLDRSCDCQTMRRLRRSDDEDVNNDDGAGDEDEDDIEDMLILTRKNQRCQ